jgi:beta-aspartyl-peptidase (threonine type)
MSTAWLQRLPLFLSLAILAIFGYFSLTSARTSYRDIEGVLRAQVEAWNRGDLDTFCEPYSDEPDLSFFSTDKVTVGKSALLERYRQRYQAEGKEMGQLTFSDLRIIPMGDRHAMVLGRWSLAMHKDSPNGLFTLAMQKTSSGWKITHDHTSQADPVAKKQP